MIQFYVFDRRGEGNGMKKDVQLSLDSFNTASPLRCKADPGQNAFKKNCLFCVHAKNRGNHIFCSRFKKHVPRGEKYSLKEWKSTRGRVLGRDGDQCIICGNNDGLHIHHIDTDPTNDDPSNLVTLCSFCHGRAHAELHRPGGADRVQIVLDHCRLQRKRETSGEQAQ
jgi:5-methylcytosine-specific restriction endonuclease McrA